MRSEHLMYGWLWDFRGKIFENNCFCSLFGVRGFFPLVAWKCFFVCVCVMFHTRTRTITSVGILALTPSPDGWMAGVLGWTVVVVVLVGWSHWLTNWLDGLARISGSRSGLNSANIICSLVYFIVGCGCWVFPTKFVYILSKPNDGHLW